MRITYFSVIIINIIIVLHNVNQQLEQHYYRPASNFKSDFSVGLYVGAFSQFRRAALSSHRIIISKSYPIFFLSKNRSFGLTDMTVIYLQVYTYSYNWISHLAVFDPTHKFMYVKYHDDSYDNSPCLIIVTYAYFTEHRF